MWKYSSSGFLAALLLGIPLSAHTGRAPMRISSSPHFGAAAQHARIPASLYLGSPFWTDAYLPAYEPGPSVIVVQAPPERPSAKAEDPKPAAPLLIEWQGDRYVRRAEATEASSRATQPDYVATPLPVGKHSSVALPVRPEPPPATFVFRDGHCEQSSDYSIISGVIYARGDYWTSGSWSKQIPLAQLDLPATFKANQEHGVAFRLPTAPNEVVTRP